MEVAIFKASIYLGQSVFEEKAAVGVALLKQG